MGGFGPGVDKQVNELKPDDILDEILDENYVLSSRVRTGRSIRGFRLPPSIHEDERNKLKKLSSKLLKNLMEILKDSIRVSMISQMMNMKAILKSILCLRNQSHHSSLRVEWQDTGQVEEECMLMTLTLSLSGLMKKIILELFQCRRVEI